MFLNSNSQNVVEVCIACTQSYTPLIPSPCPNIQYNMTSLGARPSNPTVSMAIVFTCSPSFNYPKLESVRPTANNKQNYRATTSKVQGSPANALFFFLCLHTSTWRGFPHACDNVTKLLQVRGSAGMQRALEKKISQHECSLRTHWRLSTS